MVRIASVVALASAALAAPLTERQMDIPAGWEWSVENWHAGCGRSGCSYNFNVTVPTVEGQIGGVKAYCSGQESVTNGTFTSSYKQCQLLEGSNNYVMAKFAPRESQGTAPQEFAFAFTKASYEGSAAYTFTAYNSTTYNAFVSPLLDFDVTPTEVYGTA
ncbi:hypothetical protein F5Y15DRAFT_401414 [Xylariaceae sp. FL0016]|nr:hypothetical protein F5Y15DRAFT_401414 [Xylariaceae sp. FL0016]